MVLKKRDFTPESGTVDTYGICMYTYIIAGPSKLYPIL